MAIHISRTRKMLKFFIPSIFLAYYSIFILDVASCERKGNIIGAIAHMEPLVEIERRLIKIAREYIDRERFKLSGLREFALQVDEALRLSKDEPIKYLGNPINSYLIIKRFTSGWVDLAERLKTEDDKVEDIESLLRANDMYLPVHDIDMVGATSALFRLQDTYDISAREISDGVIKGVRRSYHQLSAQDCIDIAKIAHDTVRYVRMKQWVDEADRLLNDPLLRHRRGGADMKELYEYLSWGNYLSGNMFKALHYTNKVLELDPSNEHALNNREFYEFYEKENVEKWLTTEQWDYNEAIKNNELFKNASFSSVCRSKNNLVNPYDKFAVENQRIYSYYVTKNIENTDPETTYMSKSQLSLDAFINSSYIQACRKTHSEPKNLLNENNLTCWYHKSTPRFILKPLRVTRVHDNPEVLIYHHLLYEWEIIKFKEISTPRLRAAEVIDAQTNEHITAHYRVSKNLFFDMDLPDDKNISDPLASRLEEATNLNLTYAENFQVNNYGLGGQYEFHIDHGDPGTYLDMHPNGNRIATLLIYLTDVEAGGHTVFTRLGLSVPPKKGDVVFWYNLFRNGTGNNDTQHASCPVLSGSKWVVNKWVHTHGNEFTRPCHPERYYKN